MARNNHYHPDWIPLEGKNSLAYSENTAKGVITWMNPTQSRFKGVVPRAGATQELEQDVLPPKCRYYCNTRDARKGRTALIIDPTNYKNKEMDAPPFTNSTKAVFGTIWRMFSTLPYTNFSWWTAIIFTPGSAAFIASSFMSFLPLQYPDIKQDKDKPTLATEDAAWAAFAGSVVFALGSVFMMLEAVNERRTARFGYQIYQESNPSNPGAPAVTKFRPTKAKDAHTDEETRKAWIWLPKWTDFKTHYIRQLGFVACMIQAVSSLFFLWSNFCGMPPSYRKIASSVPKMAGAYWLPKFIGCMGFLISGILLSLETQPAWLKPAFGMIGWWIGFFKVIGATLFLLGAGFGAKATEWAEYWSAILTLTGSFAFLIGSVLLWYEASQPYPVLVKTIDKLDGPNEQKQDGGNAQVKASTVSGTHPDNVESNEESAGISGIETDSITTMGSEDVEAQVKASNALRMWRVRFDELDHGARGGCCAWRALSVARMLST